LVQEQGKVAVLGGQGDFELETLLMEIVARWGFLFILLLRLIFLLLLLRLLPLLIYFLTPLPSLQAHQGSGWMRMRARLREVAAGLFLLDRATAALYR
jgi:hypothetical protein